MTYERCAGCGRVLLWVHGSLRCCNANCTNPSPPYTAMTGRGNAPTAGETRRRGHGMPCPAAPGGESPAPPVTLTPEHPAAPASLARNTYGSGNSQTHTEGEQGSGVGWRARAKRITPQGHNPRFGTSFNTPRVARARLGLRGKPSSPETSSPTRRKVP